ncbi:MAG: hypothetical protein LUD18_07470 [Lachnospiraceae bacterium]|nr:hypothetical protein [Lachnospiraceae bacterium]
MEENRRWQETAELSDDDMDLVSGGASPNVTLTGELRESIYGGDNMNDLWNKLYAHGDYGKQVKEVVDEYTKWNGMQAQHWRWTANEDLLVYAKDGMVQLNGKTIYQCLLGS